MQMQLPIVPCAMDCQHNSIPGSKICIELVPRISCFGLLDNSYLCHATQMCWLSIPRKQPGVPSMPDRELAGAFEWWEYAIDHWQQHACVVPYDQLPQSLQNTPLVSLLLDIA